MKTDNEKVLRRVREKKTAIVMAKRRRVKETVRRMESRAYETQGKSEQ